MIYIGFSTKTHKFYARVLCKKYKHCAPVICVSGKYQLYQFTSQDNINIISLNQKDLSILQHYGWVFIKYKGMHQYLRAKTSHTCVQFTKQVCGIKNIWLQTPDALYKYLAKQ